MTNIYFFQWISDLGGADTRLKELIQLFSESKKYRLFSIPNDDFRLNESENTNFLKEHGVKILSWNDLPKKDTGFGISFCNFRIFSDKWRIEKIKSMGLKYIWSNDMMWRTSEETENFKQNLVDAVIYTSEQHYLDTSTVETKTSKENIIPNFFYLKNYPYINREHKNITTIGKHSRSDEMKFSDNFPIFYKNLNITNPFYRVMGFNKEIRDKFKWFNFNNQWQLLNEMEEKTIEFLKSLDVYIYNSHYKFTETQCRATIEAMLTGLPVIAPAKYNFKNQISNGKSGFLWETYEQCQEFTKILEKNFSLRREMGIAGRELSKNLWCDPISHLKLWENLFNSL
jgi:Glycosyl transferases group 1